MVIRMTRMVETSIQVVSPLSGTGSRGGRRSGIGRGGRGFLSEGRDGAQRAEVPSVPAKRGAGRCLET